MQEPVVPKPVIEPPGRPCAAHGLPNPSIIVSLGHGDLAPIMLNRHVDSGYRDHPLREVPRDARMGFISLFDWDQLDYRDHRCVRAQVLGRASEPAVVGTHAFIEARHVRFGTGWLVVPRRAPGDGA